MDSASLGLAGLSAGNEAEDSISTEAYGVLTEKNLARWQFTLIDSSLKASRTRHPRARGGTHTHTRHLP